MSRESVLITGSSKGLGRELALVFSQNNYNVILHGRNETDLEDVRKKVLENNVDCYIVQGDIGLSSTIKELSRIAKEKDISILINNAGISSSELFEDSDTGRLEEMLKVNLFAPIKLTRDIYPLLVKKRKGTIININSVDAQTAKEKKVVYCATKWGLRGFTESLKREAKKNNIRIIGVYLGGMKTAMYDSAGADSSMCMEPPHVARIIYNITQTPPDVNVDDITINRQMY